MSAITNSIRKCAASLYRCAWTGGSQSDPAGGETFTGLSGCALIVLTHEQAERVAVSVMDKDGGGSEPHLRT
jgi:hypothetical protein